MGPLCVLCRSEDMRRVRRYRTHTKAGKFLFHDAWLQECARCGLVQAVPSPSHPELGNYYSKDYREVCCAGADVADPKQFPRDNLFYFNRGRSIAQLVSAYVRKEAPRILDIGAGYGHVLHAFGQLYPRSARTAIEFSAACRSQLESQGIRVFVDPVEEILPRLRGQFDVAILSHVLEHLLDPFEVLQVVSFSLAEGGILYVEVPNIPKEALLVYPDHVWAPRFDEPHISFFSQASLRGLLAVSGFEPVLCDTAGPEYRYVSSLRYRLPPLRWFVQGMIPRGVFHFLRRQPWTRPFRVRERDSDFYQYGGCRIWIRSVSRKGKCDGVADERANGN